MEHDDNPYTSPQSPSLEFIRRPGVDVALVSSGWLYRCFRVKAPIEAVIAYRGRWVRELVTVNDITMCQKVPVWWWAPLFEFDIETDQASLPVQVHVRVNWRLQVCGFQLWLDDDIVYEEGQL
jgi:hypothetical protein